MKELVAYYSMYRHIYKLAQAVEEGVQWRKKMKRTILIMAAIISMNACQTKSSENKIESEKQEIKTLLLTYSNALNASDVSKVQTYTSEYIETTRRLTKDHPFWRREDLK